MPGHVQKGFTIKQKPHLKNMQTNNNEQSDNKRINS